MNKYKGRIIAIFEDYLVDPENGRPGIRWAFEPIKVEQRIEDLKGSSTPWEQYIKFGLTLLTDLPHYYQEAAPEVRDMLIGSIFPEKLIFDGKKYRTARKNVFVSLITSGSGIKKSRSKNRVSLSGHMDFLAPPPGLEPGTY